MFEAGHQHHAEVVEGEEEEGDGELAVMDDNGGGDDCDGSGICRGWLPP